MIALVYMDSKHNIGEKLIFGFDRNICGDTRKKNRKWWHALREDRSRDIENETL
jgi:hypothetical protein